MNLIIKINKLPVWEFELGDTDEFSIEYQRLGSVKKKKVLESEKAMFEAFRKQYPGVKRGLETEFLNFIKKYPSDWKECLPMLLPSIMLEKEYKKKAKFRGEFVPHFKNLQTWINNRCWEIEYDTRPTPNLGVDIQFQKE